MRSFLIMTVLAATLLPASAHSQMCGPLTALEKIISNAGEGKLADAVMPFAGGQSFPAQFFVNLKTGSWSLVYTPRPDILCIYALGTGFRPSIAIKGDPS